MVIAIIEGSGDGGYCVVITEHRYQLLLSIAVDIIVRVDGMRWVEC